MSTHILGVRAISVNPYFNKFNHPGEQSLIESLIVEAIQIHGIDMYYLPRTLGAVDDLLNEDDLSSFNKAIQIEMYVKNVEGFEGEGDLLSKFGLQIKDQITFTMARKRFFQEIGTPESMERPKEGDLLYFPLSGKLYEVTHVEHEQLFYQFGILLTFDLKCELFEYSNERFNTGIPFIDNRYIGYETTSNTAIENIDDFDPFADNNLIQDEANTFADFTETDPFSVGGKW